MPRINSSTWSVNDQITAARLHDFNEDIDDLYSKGSDRLRVVAAASGTPLRIDVGAGTFNSGGVIGNYAGGTDIVVTNAATNYVEINDAGSVVVNTSGWTTSPDPIVRLAIVVCSGGAITSITLWKTDAVGGAFGSVDSMFGDGSDGAKTVSSSEDLNPAGEFEYTTLTINASQTVSVTSVNSVLVIKCQGDVTINGTIDLNGKGGAGGAQVAVNTNGITGTAGNTLISGLTNGAGVGATKGTNGNGGGGGGASIFANGAAGSIIGGSNAVAGTGGTALDAHFMAWLANAMRGVGCGGGGGSGSGTYNSSAGGVGGAGGAGGGALVMFIGGNLTLGVDSVLRADGVAGANGGLASPDGGAGGGGGGGCIFIIVAGSITDNGVAASAAAGAAGSDLEGNGGNGGAGAAGRVWIYSLADGTSIVA